MEVMAQPHTMQPRLWRALWEQWREDGERREKKCPRRWLLFVMEVNSVRLFLDHPIMLARVAWEGRLPKNDTNAGSERKKKKKWSERRTKGRGKRNEMELTAVRK